MAEMDFNAAHEDDVFLFDPTVADDVAELACLDDLDLDWSDPPSSLGLGDDAEMQEPRLGAPGPAAGPVDGVTDVAEIDPLPWSAGSVERQPTALRTTSTGTCGTSTITSNTNRTVKRASNAHCVPTTTDKLDGNTETRNAEKSFLGFGRKKEHPKTVDLPPPSSKVPSAVVSNVHATGKPSPKAKVFPDPVRSEGKPVFSTINVVGNSSLENGAIKSGGFPLPPSASSSEGSVSGDASTGGGSSTGPPPTVEEAAAEARRRRAQRRDILDQKRRARRQKRQHQHSPPSTTSSSGTSVTGREAAPPASATEVAAIAQKLLVNASQPPPRPAPAVVIPPSVASTSPSPSAETLPTRASSRFAGATSAPSATGVSPAKPTPSVPPTPKAKRAPTKSKPMSPPSTITFKKESSPTEGVPSSSSFLLADEDVTELTEDMLPKGTDPESRKQRRLIRNRLSAALHRKRKRETLDNQKKMIEDRDDAIADLRGQLEKMTARCKSLETDLGVIMRCYGASQINRILEESRSGVIPRGDTMATDSPPHLVNISSSSSGGSGSDRSTCSEDTPSPPPSPTHHSSLGESEEEEKQPGTTTTLVASRKGNNNNKRKRAVLTGLGFYPAVATVAMCGLLGCMMLPPSVLRNPEQEVEPPSSSSVAVNPHAEGGEGRRRLQAVFPSEDDEEEEKAISRWSNLESKWPGLDPDQLLGGGAEGGGSKRHPPSSSWVISPIEMYPSLWTVDERISKTPWTVERSIQLFDFRSSKISPPSASAAKGAAEGSSVLPLRLFPDAYPLKAPPGRESKTSSSATRMLRGGAVVGTTVVTDQTEASNNEGDGNMDYEYVDADDADMGSAESSAGDGVIGSSFMFCPAASAVFSPGLLQLAGISGDTTGSGKDGQAQADDAASRWQWGGTFSDDDPDGDILHSGATHPSPYPVTTLNSLIGSPVVGGDDPAFDDYYRPGSPTTNGDDAGSDESKALVPTYLDYYRKKLLTTFSASSSEFSSHGRGGSGGGVPIIKTVLGGDDPYMTILVPASAISGGGAATDFSESRSSPRWLELGCQVLSARVVDGVNFVGDPTPLRHHEHEDRDDDEDEE